MWKPRAKLGSLLLLMVLAGILAAILAPRAEQHGFPVDGLIDTAFVLYLLFSIVVLVRSVRLFAKHGNKSLVLGPFATTLGGLAILLYVASDKGVVTAIAAGLWVVSLAVTSRAITLSRRDIARLEAAAADRNNSIA